MARTFVRLVLFPPLGLPVLGGLLFFLGGVGLYVDILLVFAASLCMAFLPGSILSLRRYEADSLTVCCQVLLGITVTHLTVASLDVLDFTAFLAKAGSLPLFILVLRGSVFWIGLAGAFYGIMLSVAPGRARWGQSISLSLSSLACLFAIREIAPYLHGVDPLVAINANPWETLAWIGLSLILLYKINKRQVLS